MKRYRPDHNPQPPVPDSRGYWRVVERGCLVTKMPSGYRCAHVYGWECHACPVYLANKVPAGTRRQLDLGPPPSSRNLLGTPVTGPLSHLNGHVPHPHE